MSKEFDYHVKIPVISIEYLAGLIDGEGCFSIQIFSNPTSKMQLRIRTSFQIHMSVCAYSLLRKVKGFLKCGYFIRSIPYGKEKLHNYRITICKNSDIINKLIPLLDNCPLILKKKDYKIFREASILIYNKEHLTKEGFLKIMKLRDKINIHTKNKYRTKNKIILKKMRCQ